MSGVDYSKWDKMAGEISDSDDENASNVPQVTTFEEPQSVTFGGTAASQATEGWPGDPSGASSAAPTDGSAVVVDKKPAMEEAIESEINGVRTTTASPVPKIMKPVEDAQLTENGGFVCDETSGQLNFVWRQTRTEVVVVVPAPAGIRAVDIGAVLMAKPKTVAEGVGELLRVVIKGEGGRVDQQVLLEGELSFQVKLESEGDVDWELKDFPGTVVARDTRSTAAAAFPSHAASGGEHTDKSGSGAPSFDRRGIEVTLRKHCPIPGAAVWWKSFLKGGPEIDVSSIPGRTKNSHQAVWEEALGMFKEKVAARKAKGKISVDIGGD